jgi:protein-S-isoprenylcysteine O-methyltransferase Ste14
MTQETVNKSYQKINIVFIAAYFSILIMIIFGYFFGNKNGIWDTQSNEAITLTSIYYIFLIATIPFSLYFFNKKSKQWAALSNETEKLKKYERGAIWRVVGVGASGFIGTIINFFLINSTSIIFCVCISVVALLFCKTNTRTIFTELNFDDKVEH